MSTFENTPDSGRQKRPLTQPQSLSGETRKQPYTSPHIHEYGSLADLTHGGSGAVFDGFGYEFGRM